MASPSVSASHSVAIPRDPVIGVFGKRDIGVHLIEGRESVQVKPEDVSIYGLVAGPHGVLMFPFSVRNSSDRPLTFQVTAPYDRRDGSQSISLRCRLEPGAVSEKGFIAANFPFSLQVSFIREDGVPEGVPGGVPLMTREVFDYPEDPTSMPPCREIDPVAATFLAGATSALEDLSLLARESAHSALGEAGSAVLEAGAQHSGSDIFRSFRRDAEPPPEGAGSETT